MKNKNNYTTVKYIYFSFYEIIGVFIVIISLIGRDLAFWSVALQSICVAVEREDLGSSPARGGRFLSTESTCVLTL